MLHTRAQGRLIDTGRAKTSRRLWPAGIVQVCRRSSSRLARGEDRRPALVDQRAARDRVGGDRVPRGEDDPVPAPDLPQVPEGPAVRAPVAGDVDRAAFAGQPGARVPTRSAIDRCLLETGRDADALVEPREGEPAEPLPLAKRRIDLGDLGRVRDRQRRRIGAAGREHH